MKYVWLLAAGLGVGLVVSCGKDDDDQGTGGTGGSATGAQGGQGGEATGGQATGGGGGTEGGAGGGGGGEGGECNPTDRDDPTYQPVIDPDNFVSGVDNPFFPLVPGTTTVSEGGEHVEVTVTSDTKVILGVTTTTVRDTVTVDGEVVEDTFDWFAQDKDGNVWYFGEDTKEFENGEVASTEGSWEAGVDGARPGIVMFANPPPAGIPYRQEYLPCVAEDMAEIVSTNAAVSVPYGDFTGCIQTREFTPLEPDANEYKFYCKNVGFVLEEDVKSGARNEVTSITTSK